MANPLQRQHEGLKIYNHGTFKREDFDSDGPMDDPESSPIEDWARKQQDIANSQKWNNQHDAYGFIPYDGTDTSLLLPPSDPNYNRLASNDPPPQPTAIVTTTTTSGGSTPAGRTVSAAAIVIPIFLILALITCLGWLFYASGYNRAFLRRRKSKQLSPQTVASDLETGRPPRVLSPSVPLPTSEPRTVERGWLFMPQFGNWVRGYRRRSDPQGEGSEDWQLDVNDVGEAPPEYTEAEREKQAEVEGNVRRMRTNGTAGTGASVRSEDLPEYNAVDGTETAGQDEVHGRETDGTAGERDDVAHARRDEDEKNGSS